MSNHRYGKGSTTLNLFIFISFMNAHMCVHMYVHLCSDQKSMSGIFLDHSPCYFHMLIACVFSIISDCGECAHVYMRACVLYMCLCVYFPEKWKLKPIALHLSFGTDTFAGPGAPQSGWIHGLPAPEIQGPESWLSGYEHLFSPWKDPGLVSNTHIESQHLLRHPVHKWCTDTDKITSLKRKNPGILIFLSTQT